VLYRCHLRGGKKGGPDVGPTKCGKGTKIMAVADRNGLPIALHIAGASIHEGKLVERTLDHRFVRQSPGRLIGDKAYDDDGLDARLKRRRIKMISPHRKGRKRPDTQDGRELRRYVRRWKIERFFAWLKNFRRVCNRWEHKTANFAGFVKLATIMILARNYF
jgi:transposase